MSYEIYSPGKFQKDKNGLGIWMWYLQLNINADCIRWGHEGLVFCANNHSMYNYLPKRWSQHHKIKKGSFFVAQMFFKSPLCAFSWKIFYMNNHRRCKDWWVGVVDSKAHHLQMCCFPRNSHTTLLNDSWITGIKLHPSSTVMASNGHKYRKIMSSTNLGKASVQQRTDTVS